MEVKETGRLQFEVSSRSRIGVVHYVDLEGDGEKKYRCSCERFTLSQHHHGEICPHIEAAVEWVLKNYTLKSRSFGS